MIKTAIIGASGFIGSHLWRSYRQSFPDCVGTSFSRHAPGLTPFDIRQPDLAALRLEKTGHEAVLITSARPNVAFCEQQPSAALAVNVGGMLELIRQIGRTSMSVIFLSSDYVFEGTTGQYADNAAMSPTTEYGRQKALVERTIPSLIENFLILRLSKIYGLAKNDGTLLDDIARGLATNQEIKAAADQFFCPTEVTDLVRAIHAIQAHESRRVMNVCSPESWSRYGIACALADAMHLDASRINKVSLHDIPTMKDRPLNTTMIQSSMESNMTLSFADLRDSVRRVAANWIGDRQIHLKVA
jgi:dTDP-4-dehydrorhamnose reductase